jgi:hypothetical protein
MALSGRVFNPAAAKVDDQISCWPASKMRASLI